MAAIKAINTDALLRATNQFQRTTREPKNYTRPLFGMKKLPTNMRDMREYITDLRGGDET